MYPAMIDYTELQTFVKIIISDINECATGTPCNSGSCSNTPGTFTCDCTGTGFEGDTCQNGNNDCFIMYSA